MPGPAGSVNLKVSADTVAMQRALHNAKGHVAKFAREAQGQLNGLGKSFGSTFKGGAGAAQAALAGLSLPMAAFARDTVQAVASFEAGMNKVQAVTGATGKSLERLEQQAKTLGSTTKFSATQAAEAQIALGQAGFDTNKILSAMPATLNLAAAGALDLGKSADILTNVLSGFRKPAEDAGKFADLLAKAAASSNTDVTQMGDALKKVAPLAAELGIEADHAAAQLAVLADNGIKGAEAGTALRSMMNRLLRPTGAAKDVMEKFSIESKDLNTVLRQLNDAGASSEDMIALFGEEFSTVAAAMKAGLPKFDQFLKALQDSEGAAKKMADTMDQGLLGAWTKFKSAVEGLQIAIGDSGIKDQLVSILETFTGLVNTLSKIPKPVLYAGTVIGGLAATVGTLTAAIATLNGVFGTMLGIKGIAGIAAALGPAAPLAAAIAGITAALYLGVKAFQDFEEAGKRLQGFVKSASDLGQTRDALEDLYKLVKSNKDVFDKIAPGGMFKGEDISIKKLADEQKKLYELEQKAESLRKQIAQTEMQRGAEATERLHDLRDELEKTLGSVEKGKKHYHDLAEALQAAIAGFEEASDGSNKTGSRLATASDMAELARKQFEAMEGTLARLGVTAPDALRNLELDFHNLNIAVETGRIDVETYHEAWAALQVQWDAVTGSATNLEAQLRAIGVETKALKAENVTDLADRLTKLRAGLAQGLIDKETYQEEFNKIMQPGGAPEGIKPMKIPVKLDGPTDSELRDEERRITDTLKDIERVNRDVAKQMRRAWDDVFGLLDTGLKKLLGDKWGGRISTALGGILGGRGGSGGRGSILSGIPGLGGRGGVLDGGWGAISKSIGKPKSGQGLTDMFGGVLSKVTGLGKTAKASALEEGKYLPFLESISTTTEGILGRTGRNLLQPRPRIGVRVPGTDIDIPALDTGDIAKKVAEGVWGNLKDKLSCAVTGTCKSGKGTGTSTGTSTGSGKETWDAIKDHAIDKINEIGRVATAAWNQIGTIATGTWNQIGQFAATTFNSMISFAKSYYGAKALMAAEYWKAVLEISGLVWNAIGQVATLVLNEVGMNAVSMVNQVGAAFVSAANQTGQAFVSAANQLASVVSKMNACACKEGGAGGLVNTFRGIIGTGSYSRAGFAAVQRRLASGGFSPANGRFTSGGHMLDTTYDSGSGHVGRIPPHVFLDEYGLPDISIGSGGMGMWGYYGGEGFTGHEPQGNDAWWKDQIQGAIKGAVAGVASSLTGKGKEVDEEPEIIGGVPTFKVEKLIRDPKALAKFVALGLGAAPGAPGTARVYNPGRNMLPGGGGTEGRKPAFDVLKTLFGFRPSSYSDQSFMSVNWKDQTANIAAIRDRAGTQIDKLAEIKLDTAELAAETVTFKNSMVEAGETASENATKLQEQLLRFEEYTWEPIKADVSEIKTNSATLITSFDNAASSLHSEILAAHAKADSALSEARTARLEAARASTEIMRRDMDASSAKVENNINIQVDQSGNVQVSEANPEFAKAVTNTVKSAVKTNANGLRTQFQGLRESRF